jgi:hypothetical protein
MSEVGTRTLPFHSGSSEYDYFFPSFFRHCTTLINKIVVKLTYIVYLYCA